ncbi:MAG TPA: peptide-methionine (S)-S-oxide reductase MsrA [Saprospiraceae bacterium]|nr:peptide-methionine (S)-S-oxide reductase MsrA [Saprospiraceae bacterium]HPI04981.1 peptide-methionine (S)-S-oxide reductase MsrA [Saprospiraceae bacterium]
MKYTVFLLAMIAASCHSAQNVSPEKKDAMTTTAQSATPVTSASGQTEVATLGAGCFWCVEAIYQDLQGVLKVESGYSGGNIDNPSYREVCTGATGHAEVIQVTFDPAVISFKEILEVFFTVHDPTTLNRQGADSGTQYRSAIFYHSPQQKTVAEEVKLASKEIWDDPIVTEIAPFDKFFKAEDYHQNYFKENPNQGYCSIVIAPKVKKFRQKWANKLKP